MVSPTLSYSMSWRAHTSRRTSHWRLCCRIWWLALDSVDRSHTWSWRLPVWHCATGYLSPRNSETPSQTHRYALETHGCPKWSHPARHGDCNILRTLEDVSHRAYRHRPELRSRLHFCGHLSVVHRHPRCPGDHLQLHPSAGRDCLQCSYPRCFTVNGHVYYH